MRDFPISDTRLPFEPQSVENIMTTSAPQTELPADACAGSVPGEVQAGPSGSDSAPAAAKTFPLFAIIQLGLVAAAFAYGSQRYTALEESRLPPEPQNEPWQVTPLHDRPDLLSDADLNAALARLTPRFRAAQPQINHVDHALRFWGADSEFADPDTLSGVEMRELLTDHRAFAQAWGDKTRPFLLADTTEGQRPRIAFRTKSGPATASHIDHTLAGLAEVGTPLDFPVNTPTGELPLRAAFEHTFRRFSLNQDEYEWSTLVFIHYLTHTKDWFTTEGQQVTWDTLADRMMRQRLAQGVCYGNHRLYTLAALLRADADHQLLSDAGRQSVIDYLRDVTRRLSETQHPDGYWDGHWPGPEWDGPQPADVTEPLGQTGARLLATGHALEWWAIAPRELHPSDEVLRRGLHWTVASIRDLSDSEIRTYYTFLSHAGRALALWRGRTPAAVAATLNTVASGATGSGATPEGNTAGNTDAGNSADTTASATGTAGAAAESSAPASPTPDSGQN